jgi:hypothetical protein
MFAHYFGLSFVEARDNLTAARTGTVAGSMPETPVRE